MTPNERKAIIERGAEIQWLKFAERLSENYRYLLNLDLCLRIAEDAKNFVASESAGAAGAGRAEHDGKAS
jgi:hypothetical protein